MSEQQSYAVTWNALADPTQQEQNFRQAAAAIASVDWESLPDFGTIVAEARRIRVLGLNTPTRYGGLGLTTRQICTLFSQFERIDTASGHSVGYFNTLGILRCCLRELFSWAGTSKASPAAGSWGRSASPNRRVAHTWQECARWRVESVGSGS
jgi:hypothetical protein